MAVEWKMPRRSERCLGCETEFAVGDVIHVSLMEHTEGFERLDHCPECTQPDHPHLVGTWLTRRPEPNSKKTTQPFDKEALLGFFERLSDPQTPAQVQFRFVLALFLWRKKALEFESSRPAETGEVWIFAQGERKLEIACPDLDEAEVERLSLQLEDLMLSGIPTADPVAEEEEEATAAPVAQEESADA